MWRTKKERPPSVLAVRISQFMQLLQNRWVKGMQTIEARLSNNEKKWWLVLFMTCSCAGCVITFLSAIQPGAKGRVSNIVIVPIRTPSIQSVPAREQALTAQDTLIVRQFLHNIDSLQNSADGGRQLDSLYLVRPGMWDTIQWLKQIFK